MNEIEQLLDEVLDIDLIRAVISGPRKKDGIQKVTVRPLKQNEDLDF